MNEHDDQNEMMPSGIRKWQEDELRQRRLYHLEHVERLKIELKDAEEKVAKVDKQLSCEKHEMKCTGTFMYMTEECEHCGVQFHN